jgi:hypothetical protein
MRLKDLLGVLPNDPDIEIQLGGMNLYDYCRAYLMGYLDVFDNCTVVGADIESNQYNGEKKAIIYLSIPESRDKDGKKADFSFDKFEEFWRKRLALIDKSAAEYEERMAAEKQKAAQRRKKREDEKIKLAADLKELEELREWKKKLLSK